MKKSGKMFLCILFSFFLLSLLSSPAHAQWAYMYGGIDWDYTSSVQQTADEGYIVAGYTRSFGAGKTMTPGSLNSMVTEISPGRRLTGLQVTNGHIPFGRSQVEGTSWLERRTSRATAMSGSSSSMKMDL